MTHQGKNIRQKIRQFQILRHKMHFYRKLFLKNFRQIFENFRRIYENFRQIIDNFKTNYTPIFRKFLKIIDNLLDKL